jgi:hypothetical protein
MLTTNHVNNEVIKFRRQVISDFLRRSRFDPFMGDSSTNVIVRLADLESDGKQVNVPLVNQLSGDGVGAGTLRGKEEHARQLRLPGVGGLGSQRGRQQPRIQQGKLVQRPLHRARSPARLGSAHCA